MQARVECEGDIMIIHLSGRIDVESTVPFRDACAKQFRDQQLVFDFRDLSFVGSSGILPFLATMQDLVERKPAAVKFCGVGSEFKKVFSSTPLSAVEIFDSHRLAVAALRCALITDVAPVLPTVAQTGDSQSN